MLEHEVMMIDVTQGKVIVSFQGPRFPPQEIEKNV